ncbi:hypothetical protein MCNS_32470 [Mycobacterium conspicuum]|jgi:hypothetical protein|uniref:Uncharacterized protein n=1 Tax=Mycobacterium conspicuum TaxID=44010 RepID=A0A7I7YFX7_9MYCO|nr:hypothetical protein MCNS_32470 [Mycobacterium conspicuum]CNG92047.1 putative secreted protein [Mycobacterium tuberculosis]
MAAACVCSACGGNSPKAQSPSPAQSERPALSDRPTADTIPGDGKFVVGSEIRPGKYASEPPALGQSCVWARLRSLNESRESTIAEGVETGPVRVTIEPTDVAFHSSNCQTWRKVE